MTHLFKYQNYTPQPITN